VRRGIAVFKGKSDRNGGRIAQDFRRHDMTATSDFRTDHMLYKVSNGAVQGTQLMVRFLQRLGGVSLIVAASGLWLAPGADWSSDVVLVKIGLSASSLFLGFWLVFAGAAESRTEIEIDLVRMELRIFRPGAMGAMLVVYRGRFADFGQIVRYGSGLKFWDMQGNFVADLKVTERDILQGLIRSLQDSGQFTQENKSLWPLSRSCSFLRNEC